MKKTLIIVTFGLLLAFALLTVSCSSNQTQATTTEIEAAKYIIAGLQQVDIVSLKQDGYIDYELSDSYLKVTIEKQFSSNTTIDNVPKIVTYKSGYLEVLGAEHKGSAELSAIVDGTTYTLKLTLESSTSLSGTVNGHTFSLTFASHEEVRAAIYMMSGLLLADYQSLIDEGYITITYTDTESHATIVKPFSVEVPNEAGTKLTVTFTEGNVDATVSPSSLSINLTATINEKTYNLVVIQSDAKSEATINGHAIIGVITTEL